jgi:4-hydroxythreonine-4-phosphate dehydrogenase
LALTVGDPAGIGPEIILKALAHPEVPRAEWVVYGSRTAVDHCASALGLPSVETSGASLLDISGLAVETAVVSAEAGRQAALAVIRAAEDSMRGRLRGLVTAPLNKEAMHIAGFDYPGHTELLAHVARTPNVAMMFVGGKIRVALLTIHAPLKDVPRLVTAAEIVRVATLVHEALPRFGASRARSPA